MIEEEEKTELEKLWLENYADYYTFEKFIEMIKEELEKIC